MEGSIRVLKEHPADRVGAVVGLILLGLALPAAYFASAMRVDNRLERWIDPSDAVAERYAGFLETFGSEEFVLVAYQGEGILGESALDAQLGVLDELEAIDGVTRVLSIAAVYRDIFGAEDIEAFRDEVLATPFYEKFLYNPEPEVGACIVELEPGPAPDARNRIVAAVRRSIVPLSELGWEVHLAGSPVLGVVIDELSREESLRTFPLAVLCSMVVLWVLFRSLKAVAVAMICGGLAVLLTVGLMVVVGYPLTLITAVLPSLLWVLSLAGIIHLLRRYQSHAVDNECTVALQHAVRDVAAPCALASVTTALGFLSLQFAGMEPVRELGLFSFVGLLISLGVNLLAGPLLVQLFRVPAVASAALPRARWEAPVNLALRVPWVVIAIALIGIVIGIVSLRAIRVEIDPLAFLPRSSETVASYEFVSENIGGYHTLETVIQTPDGWLEPSAWPVLDAVRSEIEAAAGVARVLTPIDVLRKLNQWEGDLEAEDYRLPETREEADAVVQNMDPAMRPLLARLVADDDRRVRLSMFVTVMNSARFDIVVDAANRAIERLPEGYSGYVTGLVPQLLSVQLKLAASQVQSFAFAFATILLCLAIGLRSFGLIAVSIPANLLPIFAAFATMAYLDLALDAATIMVASIALGIAVDDTVHTLVAYRRARVTGETPDAACRAALANVGPAIVITTATACIGFLVLIRSAFLPIAWFGMLSGVAMLVALLADYLLVPALLVAFSYRKG